MWRYLAALTLVLVAACSTEPEVDWENYAPEVKQRIDALTGLTDCAGLQEEFDSADSNDAAQRARVGSGNGDLMSYIDDKLEEAGCY